MRWQDSGFNTEDCSLMGIYSLGTLRQKIAPTISCNVIYPTLLIPPLTAGKRIGEAFPHLSAEMGFFPCPFWLPWHFFIQKVVNYRKPYLVLSGRSWKRSNSFQEQKQTCQLRFWIWGERQKPNGTKAELQNPLLTASPEGPNYFIFVEINNWPLVSPNVALQDVFQFHKGLHLQTNVCNLSHVTYNTRMCKRMCNKKPCLSHFWLLLKTKLFPE